ncbi:MAG: pyridoxamine 5'-phosphate oxidase family protein [Ginsengibacter sp.]
MDSINKQQEEDNFENLEGEAAIKKIKELIDKAPSCFFCTHIETGKPFATRPMSVQQVDDAGNLWFLSANDSHKNQEIQNDIQVQLLFQGSNYSDFLNLSGKATVSEDKKMIDELWKPILKTWFTGGVDDPRISVIKVTPEEGYYWDTKHNMAVGLLKRLTGAIIGKTMDDSIEGNIEV